ncbi:Fibropellin-1 [Holothuria leucospilota]|uniref:Fibropellin-1 n=1 Tax=Holothuria leucospilota TaxID=206669 RepID=A0A9Q1H6L3_HOLLE|nr:Fibropellin-1 [Holothuria leucospilota]
MNNPPQFQECSSSVQIFQVGQNQEVYIYTNPPCSDPDGDVTTVSCDPPTATVVTPTSQITCSCTDINGTTATSCEIPTAQNTAPLEPTCPEFTTTAVAGSGTAVANFGVITCNDAEQGIIFAVCNPASGSIFSIGTNPVSCTCTDNSGETNGCSFNVIVQALVNNPPQFQQCSSSVQIFQVGQNQEVYIYTSPSCSDPDGDVTTVSCDPPTATVVTPTSQITCSCTDINGATATSCEIPTAQNTAPLAPTCPEFTTTAVAGSVTAVADFGDIICNDAEQGIIFAVCNPASGSIFAVGTSPVSCTCTDNSGETNGCSFNVIVQALVNNPPQFQQCSSSVQIFQVGQNQVVYIYTSPSCSDPDGDVTTVSCDPPTATVVTPTSQITCSCTDINGATATSCEIPTVQNTAPLAPTCPEFTTTAVAGSVTAVADFGDIICNDAEQGIIFAVCNPASGSIFAVGTSPVSCTCTDNSGETNGCSFNVIVQALVNSPPQFQQCSSSVQIFQVGQNQVVYIYTNPPCSDPYGDVTTVTCDPSTATVVTPTSQITCSCTDINGATATPCEIPTVQNTAPLEPTCPEFTTTTVSGSVTAVADFGDIICNDAEQGIIFAVCNPASGSIFSVGTSPVSCTCTDNSGETNGCSFNVIVQALENNPPQFQQCSSSVQIFQVGQNQVVYIYTNPPCSDPDGDVTTVTCDPPTATVVTPTSQITCSCTDINGATATSCEIPTAQNTEPLAPTCPEFTTSTVSGSVTAVADFGDIICNDAEQGIIFAVCNPASGSIFSLGTSPVSCTCTDNGGLTNGCTFNVVVQAVVNNPPQFVDCASSVQAFPAGQNQAVYVYNNPSCSDPDGDQTTVSCVPLTGTVVQVTSQITCSCTDTNGATTTSCTIPVTAVDNEPPVITVCPMNVTETVLSGEQGSIVNFPQPSATDNSGTVSLSNNPEFYPEFYFPLGTTTVTYVFTDNVPLTASCTFTVTVISASPCESTPCLNGGICLAVDLNQFWCVCPNCLLGDRCEISQDACISSNQCVNGGTCRVYPGSCTQTFCDCPPCFTGANCQIAINPCDSNQCQNGGMCVPDAQSCSSYSCLCSGCATGLFCAEAFNPCSRAPCLNGGICNNIVESCVSYSCECVGCFTGYDCQLPIPDPCLRSPCMNGGICQRTTGTCVGFTCQCPQDFSGILCEISAVVFNNPCSSFPCQNEGCCITLGGDSYKCICRQSYTGILCADVTDNVVIGSDSCVNNPCGNRGTCFNSYNSNSGNSIFIPQYTCVCAPGFAGQNCLLSTDLPQLDVCTSMTVVCQNGGTCRNTYCSFSGDSGSFCECVIGFYGERCQIVDVNPCQSNPCRNDGICAPFNKYFACQCLPTFSGPTCEFQGQDVTNPVISNCPTQGIQVTVTENDNFASVTWPPLQVSDNSGHVELITSNGAPGNYPLGSTTIVITYGDAAGNTVTCSFIVTVLPVSGQNTPPSAPSCPSAPFTVNTAPGATSAVVNYGNIICTDNQGTIMADCIQPAGTIFAIGTTPVSCTCTDVGGLTSICGFDVVVQATGTNTAPTTPICPSNPFTVNAAPGATSAFVDYGTITCSDNQGIITAVCIQPSGTNFAVGTTPVSCTCTDVGGLTSICGFDVVVQATGTNTAPTTPICPSNLFTVNAAPGATSAFVDYGTITCSDNQGIITAVCIQPSGTNFAVGTTPVSCTCTDVGGLTSSCDFNVVVQASPLSTAMCPGLVTVTPIGNTQSTLTFTPVQCPTSQIGRCDPTNGATQRGNGVFEVCCTCSENSTVVNRCCFPGAAFYSRGDSLLITSPNFPSAYPPGETQTVVVMSMVNLRVLLRFFEVPDTEQLSIGRGNVIGDNTLEMYQNMLNCTPNRNCETAILGNTFWVRFVSNSPVPNGQGYVLAVVEGR